MSQIRRQPRRKTKKIGLQAMNNPFHQCLAYLPPSMALKIQKLDKIIVRHLDQLVTDPEMDLNENLLLIKQALKRQQTITNELKDERQKFSKKSHSPTTQQEGLNDEGIKEIQQEFGEDNLMLQYPLDIGMWRVREQSDLNFFGNQ